MEDKTETVCRICGYDDGDVLYDEYGCATFVICPCCHSESGIEDCKLSGVRESRGLWSQVGLAQVRAGRLGSSEAALEYPTCVAVTRQVVESQWPRQAHQRS